MVIDETTAKELCVKHNVEFVRLYKKEVGVTKKRVEKYITFICPQHKRYGEQDKKPYDFQRLNCVCKFCNHSNLKETFIEEMSVINPDIEILSPYKNWNSKIHCRCRICGYEWDGMVSALMYGAGCKLCAYKKVGEARRKTHESFIAEMEVVNPNIEILGEYKENKIPVKCRCLIDGFEWESQPSNLLNGSAGCHECFKKRMHDEQALTQEEFKEKVTQKYPNVKILGQYYNAHESVECECMEHKIHFTGKPIQMLYSNISGCPKCYDGSSSGEIKLRTILKSKNIKYIQEHIFKDCSYIKPLRYDFYCPEINTAIEFQGKQHYEPISFSSKSDDEVIEEFQIAQKRDEIKRLYCKEKGIRLIEVPYWEFETMKEYLSQYI